MRLLIVSNLYPPHVRGGYELACRNVAVGLRARGHEVEVLTSYAPHSTSDDPPWVHRLLHVNAWSPFPAATVELERLAGYEASCSQFGNSMALLQRLKAFRPELVYVWYTWGVGGLGLTDTLEHLGVPWVVHLMDVVPAYQLESIDPLTASLFVRAERSLLCRAAVIVMAEHILTLIAERTGVRFEQQPAIIPGWVDARGLRQRRRYFLGGHLRLATAGALGVHKGTDLIVDASAKLVAEGWTNFTIDVFGIGDPEAWIARADDAGVADYVRFRPAVPQSELLEALPNYDGFLFPSQRQEPFGFAPIEAGACGAVPVITRNVGSAERLVDGVHALKVDSTTDALAGAIRSMLDGSVDLAGIGRRVARYVRRDLTFDAALDAMERALRGQLRAWDAARLEAPRLPALLFAKHELGRYLTFAP